MPVSNGVIVIHCHPTCSKSPKPQKPREKQMRVWDMSGTSTKNLDYSEANGNGSSNGDEQNQKTLVDLVSLSLRGAFLVEDTLVTPNCVKIK